MSGSALILKSKRAPSKGVFEMEGMMPQTEKQIQEHIDQFKDMPDVDFIRAAIRGARYLDNQSRAIAREALRRFGKLHPETPCDHQSVEIHQPGCACVLCQQADAMERAAQRH